MKLQEYVQPMSSIDPQAFRKALGSWPTGVAVVTCRDHDGEPRAMTINSFASVSLDPPLVLWSLGKTVSCAESFLQADHFAINTLCADAGDEALRFARSSTDFANAASLNGIADLPLLDDALVRYECRVEHRYDGGDHIILVGRVLAFEVCRDDPALTFYRGAFGCTQ